MESQRCCHRGNKGGFEGLGKEGFTIFTIQKQTEFFLFTIAMTKHKGDQSIWMIISFCLTSKISEPEF